MLKPLIFLRLHIRAVVSRFVSHTACVYFYYIILLLLELTFNHILLLYFGEVPTVGRQYTVNIH